VRSGSVHGRAELGGALESLCRGEGALGLLLGGKSVGKSLLLSELARRTDLAGADGRRRAVLHVDARRCGTDLCGGLKDALEAEVLEQLALHGSREDDADEDEGWAPWVRREVARGWGGSAAPSAPPLQRSRDALTRILTLVQGGGMYLCLIVDEANLALSPLPPLSQQAQKGPQQLAAEQDTRLFLELLVALTKQSNAVNVLLVSSEHAFPHRLQRDSFFDASNFTHVIFAGEVAPAEMRALLRGAWGLGPRLSDVFLAFYGGHVHMAARALAALAEEAGEFNCASVAPVLAAHQIDACLEASEATVAPLLRQLAQHGFAAVEGAGAQAAAQLLEAASVAGQVYANAKVLGQPPRAKHGLVPSSHFMVRRVAEEVGAIRLLSPPHTLSRARRTPFLLSLQ
jgi:hypothetical protein